MFVTFTSKKPCSGPEAMAYFASFFFFEPDICPSVISLSPLAGILHVETVLGFTIERQIQIDRCCVLNMLNMLRCNGMQWEAFWLWDQEDLNLR